PAVRETVVGACLGVRPGARAAEAEGQGESRPGEDPGPPHRVPPGAGARTCVRSRGASPLCPGRASAPGATAPPDCRAAPLPPEGREPGRAGSGTAPPPGALAAPRTFLPVDGGAVQPAPVFRG